MKSYGERSTRTTKDGDLTRHVTHVPGPYGGSTEYLFVGPRDAVMAAVDGIKLNYPPAGYGTWFNWPPPPDGPTDREGKPIQHLKPVERSPGVWEARGHHSNSCE